MQSALAVFVLAFLRLRSGAAHDLLDDADTCPHMWLLQSGVRYRTSHESTREQQPVEQSLLALEQQRQRQLRQLALRVQLKQKHEDMQEVLRQRRKTEQQSFANLCHELDGALPNSGKWIDIGILSAPANFERREQVRRRWLDALRRDPASRCIRANFIMGHSEWVSAEQGTIATPQQMHQELQIEAETQKHGDIVRIALPENYKNLPDKTLQILQRGVDDGYAFIFKVDDDQNLNVPTMKAEVMKLEPQELIYGGMYLWAQQKYSHQVGPDGQFHKYFGGPAYMLSLPLARRVLGPRSLEFVSYGTKSEDMDMGRWVANVAEEEPVNWVVFRNHFSIGMT